MSSLQIWKLALILLVAPTFIVLIWNSQLEHARLQAIPPRQLPGKVAVYGTKRCGACVAMEQVVRKAKLQGFRIEKIDIDEPPAKGEQIRVRAIPTFVYFEDGKERFRSIGMMSQEALENFCRGIKNSRF